MVVVTIAGQPAAGKDTIGEALIKRLDGFVLIKGTMREFAKRFGLDVLDFEKEFAEKEDWDRKLDEWQRNEVKKYKNVVLVSWLSAINVPNADLKVFLKASFDERVRRIAKRDGLSLKKAKKYLKERDIVARERIKKKYGVDIWDKKHYDLIIDTTDKSVEEIVDTIIDEMKKRKLLDDFEY